MSVNIGILHCRRAEDVCAGCGCLQAVASKSGSFDKYTEECKLMAYFSCNGCSDMNSLSPREDEGIIEKVKRLKSEGIEVVHYGVCCKKRDGSICARIEEILNISNFALE